MLEAISNINFKANTQTADTDKTDTTPHISSVENKDTFEKTATPQKKKKKKKHIVGKIILGVVSTCLLIYGYVVLKRKLSKPSFEEIQRCFKEIFERDLSKEEAESLIAKYKELCKNDKTEDFAKKLVEQLKIDYGIEKVETTTTVTRLKDGKIKTRRQQTEFGNANPLGEINIMPSTSEDNLIRSIQGDTFSTGFHELKHIKQFAEAYKADPDKFAESFYNAYAKGKTKQEIINEYYEYWKSVYEPLQKGDTKALQAQVEGNSNQFSFEEIKEYYTGKSLDDLINVQKRLDNIVTEEDIVETYKRMYVDEIKADLDARFGKLERYAKDTPEYKKGLQYIDAYENYADPKANYEEYKNNLLEKEAWHIGDLAKKIYNYIGSIWKL